MRVNYSGGKNLFAEKFYKFLKTLFRKVYLSSAVVAGGDEKLRLVRTPVYVCDARSVTSQLEVTPHPWHTG